MYVRLGFAVAIHTDPEILLVDEVLAVGDEAFAHRCLRRIEELLAAGRTVVFVSHSLAPGRGPLRRACSGSTAGACGRSASRAGWWTPTGRRWPRRRVAATARPRRSASAKRRRRRRPTSPPARCCAGARARPRSSACGCSTPTAPSATTSPAARRSPSRSRRAPRRRRTTSSSASRSRRRAASRSGAPTPTSPATSRSASTARRGCGSNVPALRLAPGEYLVDVAVHARDGAPYDYRKRLAAFTVTAEARGVGVYFPEHRWGFEGRVRLRPRSEA